MEKKKMSLFKKLLIIFLIVIILIGIILVGVGNYFVNYAIAREGGGGDREVKNSDVVEAEELATDAEKTIAENRKKEKELSDNWVSNIKNEKVEIKSFDNLTLRGTKYLLEEDTNKWVIVCHGYHSNPESVLSIGRHFSEKGYNVLIPSMRASNESEGDYIGMGWLDKEDLKGWINLIVSENKDAEIILHGSSMGGATVLMTSGEDLPSNVKAIVEDSGYTSVWDIFASEAKVRFNLPSFPILNMFQLVANVRADYDIKEASSVEQVKNAKVPILFIHGDQDDFVPLYMCDEVYEACNSKKEKLIIKDAGHTESRYKEPETYYNKIFEFLDNI